MGKKTALAICFLVLVTGGFFRIMRGESKSYFHMDEAYSYGLMNDSVLNITDREDFMGRFHSGEYYLSYLSVEESERGDWTPVYENQKNDVHPPFYYLLLRIAAMLADKGRFTKWSGLILNLVFWAGSCILLYLLGRGMTGRREYGCLACFFGSLTVLAQETGLYIRMYEMAGFMTLLLVWTHWRLKEKWSPGNLAACGAGLVLAGLTHYYCLIIGAGMWLWLSALWIRKKEYKKLLRYQFCAAGAAIIFLLLFPWAVFHVFGGYRGVGGSLSLFEWLRKTGVMCLILNREAFHHTGFLLILFIPARHNEEVRKPLSLLVPLLIFYLLIVSRQAPYLEDRYLMPVSGVASLCMVFAVAGALQNCMEKRRGLAAAAVVLSGILLLPGLSPSSLRYEYKGYSMIAGLAEGEHPDMVYIFDKESNRFLDDIYLFTQCRESYIIDYSRMGDRELEEICGELGDTVWIFCSSGVEADAVGNLEGWEIKSVQRTNACSVYLCKRNRTVGGEYVSYLSSGR